MAVAVGVRQVGGRVLGSHRAQSPTCRGQAPGPGPGMTPIPAGDGTSVTGPGVISGTLEACTATTSARAPTSRRR
ncbi:hypothetical protein [Ornithinimicrobium kibberense]|uniref:hypothetical protein n=1 Tax=Ornithinimicrobium kibberense TaxID=282060 RepID=UPI00361842EF